MEAKSLIYDQKEDNKVKLQLDLLDLNQNLDNIETQILELIKEQPDTLYNKAHEFLDEEEQLDAIYKHTFYLLDSLNSVSRIKSRVNPNYLSLKEKIKVLERLQKLSQTIRDIIKSAQLISGLTLYKKDNEESAIYIRKIENKVMENEYKLTAPLINYLKKRKIKLYQASVSDIQSGLNWKNSVLISKGLNQLDQLDMIDKFKLELINKPFVNLIPFINQILNQQNQDNKDSAYSNLEFWQVWFKRLN